MKNFRRPQFDVVLGRLHETPHHLIVLTGPRQSGKTTLITQVLQVIDKPCAYVTTDRASGKIDWYIHPNQGGVDTFQLLPGIGTFETSRTTSWLAEIWLRARRVADSSPDGLVLAIDEVQKIENWSEIVKGLWDEDRLNNRNLHVVLLGSAPLMMLTGRSDSLLGRFETIALSHWSYREIEQAFGWDLHQYVFFGGYPGAAPLIEDLDRWRSFIRESIVIPSIECEILDLQRIDKPTLLNRVFELCAIYSGQIFAFNQMLGQVENAGNTTTLSRYLELLGRVWMVCGLPKFSGGVWSHKASSPKLNVLNSALMSAYSTYSFDEAKADRTHWGRLLESAVGAHLYNSKGINSKLHYWREGDRKVDFVLTSTTKSVAFEVQGSPFKSDWSGMNLFQQRYPRSTLIQVGGSGVPLEEFFRKPADEWFEE